MHESKSIFFECKESITLRVIDSLKPCQNPCHSQPLRIQTGGVWVSREEYVRSTRATIEIHLLSTTAYLGENAFLARDNTPQPSEVGRREAEAATFFYVRWEKDFQKLSLSGTWEREARVLVEMHCGAGMLQDQSLSCFLRPHTEELCTRFSFLHPVSPVSFLGTRTFILGLRTGSNSPVTRNSKS